ncbi:hypothetical protein Tco_0347862 [Tanacetum coccineum]
MFQDFRYSDTTHLSRSVEVLKLKKFQERCNIKAFQEWYEHVGPEVASPQDGKVTRWRRDCAWLMISRCSRSQCQIQVQGTSSIQEVNDHYNIFTRESQEYELKTKDKAIRWQNKMFPLNLLQEQMSRLYLALSGITGKATFFSTTEIQRKPHLSDISRILSNTTSSSIHRPQQMFLLSYLQQFWKRCPYNEKMGFPICVTPSVDTVIDFVYETERLLAVTNPDTQFCKCCGESSLKLMLIIARVIWEEFYLGSRNYSNKASHKASWEKEKVIDDDWNETLSLFRSDLSATRSGTKRTESETDTAAPKDDKDQGKVDSSTVTSGVSIPVSDPVKAHEVSSSKPSLLVTPPPINTEATTITTSLPKKSSISSPFRTKLDDALLKVLMNTADLIEKYSVLPGPESVKNQESEKSPKEIIKAKKEQVKKSQTKKTRQLPSIQLHEAFIADENALDKKCRQSHLIRKDDDQSSKKPRESGASATKQHPALSSTGWHITDTREAGVDSSMHKSNPESEHSEQSLDDISMQDERNVSDIEDTDNAHIPKVSTTTWFKPIPESERPATPEPEWTIPPNDFQEPEHNWANSYASTFKVPEENKLQRKTYDIESFIKWFCR